MNIENVKGEFSEDWLIKLRPFIESEKFDNIFKFLKHESSSGVRVCPESKNLFKAFRETPLKDVKCIIVGQDPYMQPTIADGLAFSCSNTMSCQPSLVEIHKEIERTVYNGMNMTDNVFNPDLRYLAKQGVLLLNKSLTTPQYKANDPRHHTVWEPFMKYLFSEIINNWNESTPVVFMGKEAQKLNQHLDWSTLIYNLPHPASATYNDGKWDCKDVFNKVNLHLRVMNNDKIDW